MELTILLRRFPCPNIFHSHAFCQKHIHSNAKNIFRSNAIQFTSGRCRIWKARWRNFWLFSQQLVVCVFSGGGPYVFRQSQKTLIYSLCVFFFFSKNSLQKVSLPSNIFWPIYSWKKKTKKWLKWWFCQNDSFHKCSLLAFNIRAHNIWSI